MQSKSIYHPSYKPLFINEIDKNDVKNFSANLSNKLRQIKLAISKANVNDKNVKTQESNKVVSKHVRIISPGKNKIRITKSIK
jgi:hypothetical protein